MISIIHPKIKTITKVFYITNTYGTQMVAESNGGYGGS